MIPRTPPPQKTYGPGNYVPSIAPRTQRLGTRRALAPPPNISLPGNYVPSFAQRSHCI